MGTEKTETKQYCDIVLVTPGNNFSLNFLISWSQTIVYFLENNYSFLYKISQSPIVSSARNLLLDGNFNEQQLSPSAMHSGKLFNNTVVCKKIIMIDSDMVWDISAIQQLLNSPYDVTVAPYVLSDFYTSSVICNNRNITKEEIKNIKEPYEIESAGLGFTCINYEVLENIKYPWFSIEEKENGLCLGEDVYFFNKIKQAGYKIYSDPRIKVGHEKFAVLTVD